MKSRILLLLGVVTLIFSCGIENIGRTDCAIEMENILQTYEDGFQDTMANIVDSNGLSNSCEACIMRREISQAYKGVLEEIKTAVVRDQSCTPEEKNSFIDRLNNKIEDLNQAIVEIYICKEIYSDCP